MPRPKKGVAKDGLKFMGTEQGLLKYEVRVTLQHGGKLRERQRTVLVDSLREAEQQRDALLEQLRAGLFAIERGPVPTAEELLGAWLKTLRYSTGVTYTTYARHFERAFGARPLPTLTTQELQAFLAAAPLSDHTVNCMRSAFCSFFAWAKKHGHVSDNAMLATERRKKVLSDEELLQSVQAAPASRAMTQDEVIVFMRTFEQVDPEVYLILGTQCLLGSRIGEAIGLHWSDIDEATGRVIVRHNFSKGRLSVPKGKRARITALAPRWVTKLQAHRARLRAEGRPRAETLVFPVPEAFLERRETDQSFWNYGPIHARFIEVLRACEITLAPRTATHAMRHTLVSLVRAESEQVVASRLFGNPAGVSERDADLRRRVGHSSQALQEHYTSVPTGKLIDLSEEVEERLFGETAGGEHGASPRKSRRTGKRT